MAGGRLLFFAIAIGLLAFYLSQTDLSDKYQIRESSRESCVDCVNFLASGKNLILQPVKIPDGRVFEVLRNPHHPEKKTIVFLHGFPDNVYTFNHQMDLFSQQGFNVLAIPLRGYSPLNIPKNNSYLAEEGADDVVKVLEQLGLVEKQSLHVVGHDWGSVVAYQVAQALPLQTKTLTLVSVPTASRFLDATRQNPIQLLYSWYMLFFQIPKFPESWLADCHGVTYLWNTWTPNPYSPERLASVCATLAADGVTAGALGWYRSNIPASILNLFHRTATPITHVKTLAVLGSVDTCVLPETFRLALRQEDYTQNLKIVEMAGSGHFPHHHDPSQFHKILSQFFNS